MRSTLQTPFWQAAYESLPEAVRDRHLPHMERAERWGLALDAVAQTLARAKGALARLFNMSAKPGSAH